MAPLSTPGRCRVKRRLEALPHGCAGGNGSRLPMAGGVAVLADSAPS